MRFRPPSIEYSPELAYVLLRAFGPEGSVPRVSDPARAVTLAAAFDLSARIVARSPLGELTHDLGRRNAVSLFAAGAASAARAQALAGRIDELVSVAAAAAVPLAFLKFAALHLHGVLPPGGRTAGDIDLLVSERRREALTAALRDRGFCPLDVPASGHHDPPLGDGRGLVVDIHHRLPGVCMETETDFATFERLQEAGALVPLPGFSGGCHLPVRDLLVAHVAVHGIEQHGFSPRSYNLMRMVADLVDLSGALDDRALARRAHRWIANRVALTELDALFALCRTLTAGRLPAFESRAKDAPEARLFRHLVAGTLDHRYRESLKLRQFFGGRSSGRRVFDFAGRIRNALRLTDGQIDGIYGRPTTPRGYWIRRALRPFDLTVRFLRSARCAGHLAAGARWGSRGRNRASALKDRSVCDASS